MVAVVAKSRYSPLICTERLSKTMRNLRITGFSAETRTDHLPITNLLPQGNVNSYPLFLPPPTAFIRTTDPLSSHFSLVGLFRVTILAVPLDVSIP
jgi:hypothetical protein